MRKRDGSPAVLWLALGGLFLALVLCGGGGLVVAWWATGARPGVTATVPQAKRTYTRDEFTKMVVGKTKDEVIAAAGRPDSTQTGGTEMWYYRFRTVDPVTGKTDSSAQLVFAGGVVARVNY